MIGQQVMKNLKLKYKPKQTLIRLKDGETFYDIRTMNIHQLVKKFALSIFHQSQIN
jgi:hypothetical protein